MSQQLMSAENICLLTHSELVGNPHQAVSGVASLKDATLFDLSFYNNERYLQDLLSTEAGIIIVDNVLHVIEGKTYVINSNPSAAFQQVIDHFISVKSNAILPGISKNAIVHPLAQIHPSATISDYCSIGRDTLIGENAVIHSHVVIGDDVVIGKDTTLFSHVTVKNNSKIGQRVIIESQSVIGSCGFGYITDKNGTHQKIQHIGNVIIEDDVEIGANCCIDRARFSSTIIHEGTKIDNLVQIGHNVAVGRKNLIVSQTGIAGSTTTGTNVVIGGQCGVAGHIHLDDYVQIASKSGVSKSLKKGTYRGVPAEDISTYSRNKVLQRKLPLLKKELQALEEKVNQILNP